MDEFIEVSFRRKDRRLRIKRQVRGGIEFDEPDPIERTVGVQLTSRGEATRQRMRRIGQVKGWAPGEFKLTISVEDGSLVLRGVDADALPEGLYALTIEIEDARSRQRRVAIEIEQDGSARAAFDLDQDNRDVSIDLTEADDSIRAVIDASSLDGLPCSDWLDADKRPTRKACFLNLLASLRSRPLISNSLIQHVDHAFAVFNDRAFMRVGLELLPAIEELVKDPNRPFYAEGAPTADIHQRLLRDLPEPPDVKAKFTKGLLSFRGEGGPSLQMVIARQPVDLPYTYAEFDLDLGNPLQDVLGFVVHMGELLDGKPTNHLDLRRELAKTSAKRYLYYDVVAG
jgi:hypothetical protein